MKVGDVVMLKSGGPKMVVAGVHERKSQDGNNAYFMCDCIWMDSIRVYDQSFNLNMLNFADGEPRDEFVDPHHGHKFICGEGYEIGDSSEQLRFWVTIRRKNQPEVVNAR
jgi:uncharacterized protein YodC (DUF2158 family)